MTPRGYVERLAAGGSPYHVALLALGSEFRGQTRSSAVRQAARWKDRVRPRWHRCFGNAGEFALAHSDAEYWEGVWRYAAVDDPVLHAWVRLDGHLIDFTFEDVTRRARRRGFDLLPPAEQEYFGVHVPTEVVRHRAEVTRVWGPVSELYLTATEGVVTLSITNNRGEITG
jgi:hypothetical protein